MKTIGWYISGLKSQKEAEKELEEIEHWFKSQQLYKNATLTSSISNGHYGWKVEVSAIEET